MKESVVDGLIVLPNIVKEAVPMLDMYMMCPAVAVVGDGIVSVCKAVVWLMLIVVATSTVEAADPIDPPVAKLVREIAVLIVEPELVRLEETLSPPLALTSPEKVGLDTTPTVSDEPSETAPPPVMLVPLLIVTDELTRPELPSVVVPARVSCPSALTVNVGTAEDDPYDPEVTPVVLKLSVVDPPSETKPPPLSPVPGVTVRELLTRSVLVTLPAPIVVTPLPLIVTSPVIVWLT